MLDIAHWPDRLTCRRLLLLAVAFGACWLLFQVRGRVTWPGGAPGGMAVPDSRTLGYSAADVQAYFDAIGSRGRGLYVATQLSLDLVFPAVYGLLFAGLIVHAFPRMALWLPFFAAAADYCENFLLVALACTFKHVPTPEPTWASVATVAACCTVAKGVFFLLSALAAAIGLPFTVIHCLRAPRAPAP